MSAISLESEPKRSWSEIDARLGERIRRHRLAQKMSLKDVAQASSISIGLLSQIERGLSSPSLRVLASLADVLKVGVADWFDDGRANHHDGERIVLREAARKGVVLWGTGLSKELLTPQQDNSPLDMFLIVLEAGGTTGTEQYSHDGAECGLVLEGSLELHVDGTDYLLRANDSFRFASTRPHRFRNPGSEPARVLWINARVPKVQPSHGRP